MRSALNDFKISLQAVTALATHILSETGAALADPNVLQRHEIQQCACPVLLTGYFESFLKDVVKAFVSALSNRGLPFASLPDRIKQVHFEGGGRVLLSLAKTLKRSASGSTLFPHTTPEDVVFRLDSARANPSGGYDILWEAFANTSANPGPDVVAGLLRDLNVQAPWPTIAAAAAENESTLTSRLGDLIVVRNACAHTGKMSPVPSPSKIIDYSDTLSKIAEGIVVVLEGELAKY